MFLSNIAQGLFGYSTQVYLLRANRVLTMGAAPAAGKDGAWAPATVPIMVNGIQPRDMVRLPGK